MSLTSTQKKDNNQVELTITAGADEIVKAAQAAFVRRAKSIAVPGFRKGKAPRKVIEKMYGEGVFLEDAMNDMYPKLYSEAIKESGVEPVDRADVEIISLDYETGLTFKATVTVKPEVTVGTYKGLELAKSTPVVTDDQVDGELAKMAEKNSRTITVDDRAAKIGDQVIIDFEGFVDGVAFPGGKADGFNLTLGSKSFIDTFEDQIVGHSIGDEFEVNVSFPQEYHAAELAGKPAMFKVKLNEINAMELPALDDEFAKDVSEFDTLEDLRLDVRAKITERAEKNAQIDFENALIDKIVEGLQGDIPDCMFERRQEDMVRDFDSNLQSRGMNLNTYFQYTGMDMNTFKASFRDQAERHVKVRLALEKIANLEGIVPTVEEIEAEYQKTSENFGVELEKVKAFVAEKDVMVDIKVSKAIDFVRDNAAGQ